MYLSGGPCRTYASTCARAMTQHPREMRTWCSTTRELASSGEKLARVNRRALACARFVLSRSLHFREWNMCVAETRVGTLASSRAFRVSSVALVPLSLCRRPCRVSCATTVTPCVGQASASRDERRIESVVMTDDEDSSSKGVGAVTRCEWIASRVYD